MCFNDFTVKQFEMRCSKAIFRTFWSIISSKYTDLRCVEVGGDDGRDAAKDDSY